MPDDPEMLEPDPAPRAQRASRADRRRRDDDDDFDDEDDEDDDDRDARYRPRRPGMKYDEDGNPLTSEDTLWALFAHLGLIVVGFLAPLIIFLVYRQKSPFVTRHAKAALNYAITHMVVVFGWIAVAAGIGFIVYGVSQDGMAGFVVGYALAIVGAMLAGLASIVSAVMGTVAAANGNPFRYPVCITFIS
jgi:uncharacterized Tic20 family protein